MVDLSIVMLVITRGYIHSLGDPCAEFPALPKPIVWERHPERHLKGIPNHVCTV